jgi:hypothetical protein
MGLIKGSASALSTENSKLQTENYFTGSDIALPLSAERRAASTISIASTLNSGLTIPSIG